MAAAPSLLEALKQDQQLSHAVSIIECARLGTKCHELRERLAGGLGGRQLTLLAPTNNAIKRAAEAKRTTLDLFCKMPEVAETIAAHAVLDRWPLAALRMLGTPLESLQFQKLTFLPSADAKVSVKLAGTRARPVRVNSGDIPCRNGLLHKLERLLLPASQEWRGVASREEAVQRQMQAQQEMLKDRRELNGKTRTEVRLPGPVSKAVAARRTASAHDRQRAQAFAPLYGDDYEPRVYTGDKPLPARRDFSHLRTVTTVPRDKIKPGQAPSMEDVWEEWEPLKQEEMRLRSELESFQMYLQSKEEVIAEHAAFVRQVLPTSGLGWAGSSQKPFIEVPLSSAHEHQLLQSCISPQDPKLITSEVRLGGFAVPAQSRLSSELPPWSSKLWLTVELPEVLPGVTFPLWSAPSGVARGMESRLQHFEAHLLIEQARKKIQSDEGLDVALLADKIGEEAHSLSDVLSWMEKRGVCWGLPDQRKFARFCEAMELLPGTSGTQENCNLSPVQDQLEQRKKEPEDQHFFSLLQRRIDKNVLAKVLSLPPLPEDHSEVQMLMTHLHHTLSLFSRNGQVIPNLKQQVSSHSDSIDVLRGRLEILESSMPSAWSPPVELWEDLMGSSPPSGLKAVDALTIVSEAVVEARRKAVRNGEEAAVASEALKASAAEKLRQVVWAESQAVSKEADIELLKQHLHEQAAHIKELEGERREGRSRAHLLNMMDAQEVARRANALCLEHHAAKVQRAWRQQQAKARLQLKAVLLLQFQMRRWRKRRQSAAKRIQERWSVFQKMRSMKRRVEGAMNQSAAWMGKQFGTQTKDAADKNAKKVCKAGN